jgi:hypothetical protein
VPLRLTPFYSAGQNGGRYVVWLYRSSFTPAVGASLFSQAEERSSRDGNVAGSIADDDPATYVVTFDNTLRSEDWYEVSLEKAVTIDQVTFVHGHCFHDGGWFDASAGKPRICVRLTPNGPWEPSAEIATYPATTASDPAGLKDGQIFSVPISTTQVYAVRVVGKPACGDNPKQAFSSCAELQATQELKGSVRP